MARLPARARVVPVVGDITRPWLGLSEKDNSMLCDRVDAICHNGSVANFVLTYRLLMPAHVGSTVEVLRMATLGRTKPVHLISTLDIFRDQRLITEADRPVDPAGLDTGYHTTKWVAETLAANARDRGLPISIHRIGMVIGRPDSYLGRLISGCAQCGAVPDSTEVIDMLPVDRLAAAIVGISTRYALAGRDFHFHRADGFTYPALGGILTEAGYPAEVLPYREWRARMLTASVFGPLAFGLPVRPRGQPVFDCEATTAAAAECGVEFPPADAAIMRGYVDLLAARGSFVERYRPAAGPPGVA